MKINIIYWSGTGNTEKMARLIAEGAESKGAEAQVKEVSGATAEDAGACDVLLLGCPSMGVEVLEEDVFEPYIASIEGKVSGKKIGLFGSYGWGDGEWMDDWESRMQGNGALLALDSLIVNEAPEGEDEEKCRAFGAQAASLGRPQTPAH